MYARVLPQTTPGAGIYVHSVIAAITYWPSARQEER
jgi:hypothetical protein